MKFSVEELETNLENFLANKAEKETHEKKLENKRFNIQLVGILESDNRESGGDKYERKNARELLRTKEHDILL